MRSLGVRGATGAAIVPFIALVFHSLTTGHAFIGVLPMIAQYTVAGALCATGSFLLARRAPSSPDCSFRSLFVARAQLNSRRWATSTTSECAPSVLTTHSDLETTDDS